MHEIVEAIYDAGVLKPTEPLPLRNGQRVLLSVQPLEPSRPDQRLDVRESELLRRLQSEGALERHLSTLQPPPDFRPVVVTGEPLSETILKARR